MWILGLKELRGNENLFMKLRSGAWGKYFVYLWVGVCCWDFETLYPIPDHVQLILERYTRLHTEKSIPYPRLALFRTQYHY